MAIMGYGAIDGQGGQNLVTSTGANYNCTAANSNLPTPCTWWNIGTEAGRLGQDQQNPTLLNLHSGSYNFTLYKITIQNSPMFHVTNSAQSGTAPNNGGFTAWDVKIIAPWSSPNTDGIDPGPNTSSGTSNITITNSFISDGDDMVAIKGNKYPISDITISHNHFYTGHGMSIGSETSGGVSNMLVTDLVMSGNLTDHNENGLRIKSDKSEGGTVKDIDYEDVCILNEYNPLIITPFYNGNSGTSYPNYVGPITMHDVHVSTASAGGTVVLEGYNSVYPLGLTLDNVVFDTAPKSVDCEYANITLGPDPVTFGSTLLNDNGKSGCNITEAPGYPDGNPPYQPVVKVQF
jgi:polygalacturonase